jgi:serine/threonine protein kinase
MNPSNWERVEQVFDEVSDLPEEQCSAKLAELCASELEIRAEVESLLIAHRKAASFLEGTPLVGKDDLESSSFSGRQLGPYVLLECIGSGGMGAVYRAERRDGRFERQVAIKVVPAALHSRELLRRFTSEQKILAALDHPNIARLLDAGVSPEGVPYFVMEYVNGIPVSEYCREHPLTLREKLELFQHVCIAVHAAHQNLIVHRDLKPANILVTSNGMPRLLDFGIAKIVDPWNMSKPEATRSLSNPMTPSYASPEQLRGENLTTATDIYSLGVILFELLAGRLPYNTTGSLPETLQAIQLEDPPELGTIDRAFRGDIETIAAKALEKEKTLRYSSAADLAGDIQHYLDHEPIEARRPTLAYQLQKFASRHRAIVVALSAIFVVLVLGVAATTWEAGRARKAESSALRERDRATRVTDFMTKMFKVSDPSEARGNTVTARELLDKASKEIDTGLSQDPVTQAQMMHIMGTVYESLGLFSGSGSLFSRAANIRRKVLGPENIDTLASQRMLGWILRIEGSYPESEKILRETLATERRTLASEHPETLSSMQMLGWTLREEGKDDEAQKMLNATFDAQRRVLGPENLDTLQTAQMLAWTFRDNGEYAEAEKLLRNTLSIQARVLGPEHPDTLGSLHLLGWALREEGQLAESEKIHRQNIEVRRRILGPEHPDTLDSMSELAGTLLQENQFAAAEENLRQILEIQRRVLGPDNPETAISRYNLACVAVRQGHKDEGISYLRDAVEHGLPPSATLRMEKDPDLMALHGDRRFNAIVSLAHERIH